MGSVVDEAEWADWADGADGTDETDVTEMALRMNALFYFDCLNHQQLKNVAHNRQSAVALYAVTVGPMGGMDESHPLDCYGYQSTCGANKDDVDYNDG